MLAWVKDHKWASAGILVFGILALLFIRARLASGSAASNTPATAQNNDGFIPTGFSGITLSTPQGGSIATFGSNGGFGPGASNGALAAVTPAQPATNPANNPATTVSAGGGTVTVTNTPTATNTNPVSTSAGTVQTARQIAKASNLGIGIWTGHGSIGNAKVGTRTYAK